MKNQRTRFSLVLAPCFLLLFSTARAEPTFYAARVAPILDRHCVTCHGPEKQKAKLRLDSLEALMRGSDGDAVVVPGDVKKSELFRRISLPATDDEVMPSDGKPHLEPDEIKIIELWIAGGASATAVLGDFAGAPVAARAKATYVPVTADWRPRAAEIAALEKKLGVHLVPRSTEPRDGLVLRTASAPAQCTDETLAQLAPVAAFIVEAELARTKVTDAGLVALGKFSNLRTLDLTRTAVSSSGLKSLAALDKLAALNLTATKVDAGGIEGLKAMPALKRIWYFATPAEPADEKNTVVAK